MPLRLHVISYENDGLCLPEPLTLESEMSMRIVLAVGIQGQGGGKTVAVPLSHVS